MRFLALLSLFSLLPLIGFSASFTLTDTQGRSITADVISIDGNQVKIKRNDGQSFELAINSLIEDDQKKLRDWQKREADKPIPDGAIQVGSSRSKFDSKRTQQSVTVVTPYTDGTTKSEKRTRITTDESWGFSITVSNQSLNTIDGLRAEYVLFTGGGPKSSPSPGRPATLQVGTLKSRGQAILKTNTVNFTKTNWSDESSPGLGSQLHGVWVRIYRNDLLLKEYSSPETLQSTQQWPKAGPAFDPSRRPSAPPR